MRDGAFPGQHPRAGRRDLDQPPARRAARAARRGVLGHRVDGRGHVNPLLYLLAYGAGFVAQGTPADMPSLARVIEQAIRFPGFAFVNVQSPCVTFGEPEAQLRAHKMSMQSLESLGHDGSDRARAMALAQDYGSKLYTGVLFRDPKPRPSFEELARERRRELGVEPARRARVLDAFRIEDNGPPVRRKPC